MQYKEQGFIGQLNARWLRSSCLIAKSETPTIEAFKIENFGGLIIILLGTFAVSSVILLLETVLCKYWTHSYSINDSNAEKNENENEVYGQTEHNGGMGHNGHTEHNGNICGKDVIRHENI